MDMTVALHVLNKNLLQEFPLERSFEQVPCVIIYAPTLYLKRSNCAKNLSMR